MQSTVKGTTHTMIDIAIEALRGIPQVHIGHIGEGASPGQIVMAHNATLIAQLSVLLGEIGHGLPPEQKTLQIGGGGQATHAEVSIGGAYFVIPHGCCGDP